MRRINSSLVVLLFVLCGVSFAENGAYAWLRYAPLDPQIVQTYQSLPAATVVLGDSPVLASAQKELVSGVRGMVGRTLRVSTNMPAESAIVIGTVEQLSKLGFSSKSADLQRRCVLAYLGTDSWAEGIGDCRSHGSWCALRYVRFIAKNRARSECCHAE
jgi:glycosyl hydrolase family 67